MRRRQFLTAAAAAAVVKAAAVAPAAAARPVATPVVDGLEHPWSLAFLPDGAALITERPGRLRLVRDGALSPPLSGAPRVFDSGQGGLFDVAPTPEFARTGELFLAFAEPAPGGGAGTAVARARLVDGALRDVAVVFRMNRPTRGGRHFGGRIVHAPDGALFLTTGDRGEPDRAQDLRDHAGKVLRLTRDGAPAPGNPFLGRDDAAPEVWSFGHRNPQGATLDQQGRLWTVEHGARGGDEINRPLPGRNYGWPVISYGRHYSGRRIGEGTAKPGMEQPVHYWDPSIAPSGLAYYDAAMFPDWRGSLLVGALRDQLVSRLPLRGDRIDRRDEERLLRDAFGRIRDVRVAPDGAVWLLTDEDPGVAVRLSRTA